MGDFNVDYKCNDSDIQLQVCLKHYIKMFELFQIMSPNKVISIYTATVLDISIVLDHT